MSRLDMNRTMLDIKAEQGECNGFMKTEWFINDQSVMVTPNQNRQRCLEIQLEIEMPCRLKIICSGKNRETDTELVDGKIVNDKYFHITSVSLGHYPINEGVLFNKLVKFTADGEQPKQTPYFYANGVAILEFGETDALLWHLKHNHFYQW